MERFTVLVGRTSRFADGGAGSSASTRAASSVRARAPSWRRCARLAAVTATSVPASVWQASAMRRSDCMYVPIWT